MAFTSVPSVATGDLWTASNHNTYIRDNFAAGVPGLFTTKGDLPVATNLKVATRLPVGASGQVLTVDPAQPSGLKWATPADFAAIINAKGDLILGTADNTGARLGVGANGQVLQADSTQATGVKWGPGGLPTFFESSFTTTKSTASKTPVVALTFNIALTKQSSLFVIANGNFRPTAVYDAVTVTLTIDGVINPFPIKKTCNNASTDISWIPFSIMDFKTGVAAGTKTITLHYYNGGEGSGPVEMDAAHVVVIAYNEV